MNSIAAAARAHMRKMEVRIEEQTALIAKLTADGRDVAEPTRTLTMLRKALEEMRFQLDRLMPAMRPRVNHRPSPEPKLERLRDIIARNVAG